MRKLLLTLGTLLVLMKAPDFIPYYANYEAFSFRTIPAAFEFKARANPAEAFEEEVATMNPAAKMNALGVHPILGPNGSMDTFYAALRKAEMKQPGGVVRILHYGDSPTTADLITADVRQLLQTQFGDAGHGYHLIAKPWAWYEHRGVDVSAEGWESDPATAGKVRDGMYGLGAVTFAGNPGAHARFVFRRQKTGATEHDLVEISGLRQPNGGSVAVFADGLRVGDLDTNHEKREEAFAAFSIPRATRAVELRVERGPVRLFGVQFSRTAPGIVYSSLGVNGAFINVLSRAVNEPHWANQLRHAEPDLIIINYGTNESVSDLFVDKQYERELREAIRRVKAAVPKASLLIMSPMDRGHRSSDGTIGTVPALARVVTTQQRVAADMQCAFYNTFLAMGGPGTMGRWYEAEPRLVGADFIHPMPGGAKIVGNLFYKAILDGYNRYKVRQLQQQFAPKAVASNPKEGSGI